MKDVKEIFEILEDELEKKGVAAMAHALIDGDVEKAVAYAAAMIAVERFLHGPLAWVNHPEWVQIGSLRLDKDNQKVLVQYRGETYSLTKRDLADIWKYLMKFFE